MQTKIPSFVPDRRADEPSLRAAPTGASLPPSLAATECCAAQLRQYLDDNGLGSYQIYYGSLDLNDITRLLPALGEADAAWELPPPHVKGGQPVAQLTYNDTHAWPHPSGFLRLFRHQAVIGRWYWVAMAGYGDGCLWLAAVPSMQAFSALRRSVLEARRAENRAYWQVIGEGDENRPARQLPAGGDGLILPEAIKQRIECEVVRFFKPEAAELYRSLNVPYRRGMLLYGPPGNGKTSLIRWIGAMLPEVSAISLRVWDGFTSDDLENVIRQWTSQAPAVLVLEDLDWLLQKVNVSTFLNLLDGIGTPAGGAGLLLIATTNHPEKLDPAVNNRPGRFDACIELPPPDASLRGQFLRRALPMLADELLQRVVDGSEGMSFAHLQEILRLSGLRAINAGRRERSADDVLTSLADVSEAHEAAMKGYAGKLDMPFGLGYLHRK